MSALLRLIEILGVFVAAGYVVVKLWEIVSHWRARRSYLPLFIAVGLLALAAPSFAACTYGTDCYCDKVVPVAGTYYDSSLLLCEDFEAPTMRSNTGSGTTTASARGSGGTNAYGPWYDQTGDSGDRGYNSYWNKTYGNGDNNLWTTGQPASPTVGSACTYATCVGLKVWHPSDLWDANAYTPTVAIFTQSSDYTSEIGSLTVPTNTASGSAGVFDGNATLVHRMAAGQTTGIIGQATWTTATEVGLTQAIGYASNATSVGIWGPVGTNASWKHNEWRTVNSPNCGYDGIFLMYNQQSRNSWPFAGFLGGFGDCGGYGVGSTNGIVSSYCSSVVATVGTASCDTAGSNGRYNAVNWQADTTLYQQTRDFPEGTYGCVRGHMSGLGTTSARMRIWFTPTAGPNSGTELLILDFTYNDDSGSGFDNSAGYKGIKWNSYANTNQGGGYVATATTTFRYEDNVHIRTGTPVSCSQIGFGTGGGGGGTPSSPILFISQMGSAFTFLHVIGFGAVLWQRRSEVIRVSMTLWRYASALPSPTKMYWVYRYKRAVKRWQKEAPLMLEHRPSRIQNKYAHIPERA